MPVTKFDDLHFGDLIGAYGLDDILKSSETPSAVIKKNKYGKKKRKKTTVLSLNIATGENSTREGSTPKDGGAHSSYTLKQASTVPKRRA